MTQSIGCISALLALCANSPMTGEFPAEKGQKRRALMFSLTCARINDRVNNHEAGDLRRHNAHYDVIVMPDKYLAMVKSRCELPVDLTDRQGVEMYISYATLVSTIVSRLSQLHARGVYKICILLSTTRFRLFPHTNYFNSPSSSPSIATYVHGARAWSKLYLLMPISVNYEIRHILLKSFDR